MEAKIILGSIAMLAGYIFLSSDKEKKKEKKTKSITNKDVVDKVDEAETEIIKKVEESKEELNKELEKINN